MIWIVLIILSISASLYFFIREKIKGHDFRLVNKIRPYMQLLLLISIELVILSVAYAIGYIIGHCLGYEGPLVFVVGIAVALMITAVVSIPLRVNHDTPEQENSFAIYLRSFRSDSIYGNKFENSLRNLIGCFYPIYEIGNPNEAVTILKKNITIFRTDTDWQETVNSLKREAKIIIIRVDGTDGLGWEIETTNNYRYKVLYIINDKKSFDDFSSMLIRKGISGYENFPIIKSFPSIVWNHNSLWHYGEYDCIWHYISQHPWQYESVDVVKNSLIYINGRYLPNIFPTFIHGNNDIELNTSIGLRILFALFPFHQQYWRLGFVGRNENITLLVNILLAIAAIAYYFILFTFAYAISIERGGLLLDNNTQLQIDLFVFICLLPIYVLSFINGPKALWLSNSYLGTKQFNSKIKQNFIKGLAISTIVCGVGFYSKHSSDVEHAQRKALMEKIYPDYEKKHEELFCRNHIDSIFTDVSSSYILINVDKYGRIDKIGSLLVSMEYAYQSAIKDSLDSSSYYPSSRDSLMTDKWYKDIAWKVVHQIDNE